MPKPLVLVTVLVKLCLLLPVHLVLAVLRVLWADVLRERYFCMLAYSFPVRGIHSSSSFRYSPGMGKG